MDSFLPNSKIKRDFLFETPKLAPFAAVCEAVLNMKDKIISVGNMIKYALAKQAPD
jgi:hypothetical protein